MHNITVQVAASDDQPLPLAVGVASGELGCAAISDGAFMGPLCTLVIPNSLLLRGEGLTGLLEGVNSCITGELDPTCSRLLTECTAEASQQIALQ